jgi:uncharacterized surface protein with fasciclin (FAS1) repeats
MFFRRPLAIVATFAVAVPLLGACSSSNNSSNGGGSGTTADAGATTDIVSTAVAAGSFTTLAKALTAANLVSTLQGPGPFTVFAPTDAAFAKLPAATLSSLLEPANQAELVKILTYHVVAGDDQAAAVEKLSSVTTLEGQDISIAVVNGGVVLNGDVNVTQANVECSNGVIHVIDTVLLPPADGGM